MEHVWGPAAAAGARGPRAVRPRVRRVRGAWGREPACAERGAHADPAGAVEGGGRVAAGVECGPGVELGAGGAWGRDGEEEPAEHREHHFGRLAVSSYGVGGS